MIPLTNQSLIITASLATSATIHRLFDSSAAAAAATSAVDSNPLGRVSETWGVWGASSEYKPVSPSVSQSTRVIFMTQQPPTPCYEVIK